METHPTLSHCEWKLMELLWQNPHTLMELVARLKETVGWSKSTVATMVRRMEEKGLISFEEHGRTKTFYPRITQQQAALGETESLLHRAFHGSLGLLVSAMASSNNLTRDDIDELYAILKQAEEERK